MLVGEWGGLSLLLPSLAIDLDVDERGSSSPLRAQEELEELSEVFVSQDIWI